MNEEGARHWSEVRRRGLGRFLLFNAIPFKGIPVALFVMLFRVLNGVEREQLGDLFSDFGRRALVFGLSIGLSIWWFAEREYKKHQQELGWTGVPVDDDVVREDVEWKRFDRVSGPLIGGITILCILVLAVWIGPCSSRW